MADFAGADAEGQRTERAVGAGVAVAADDGHAGVGDAHLRPYHVDDPLHVAFNIKEGDAEVGAVLAQRAHLGGGVAGPQVNGHTLPRGDGMIHRRKGLVGAAHRQPALA